MYIYQIMSNSFGYIDIILLGHDRGIHHFATKKYFGQKNWSRVKSLTQVLKKKDLIFLKTKLSQ